MRRPSENPKAETFSQKAASTILGNMALAAGTVGILMTSAVAADHPLSRMRADLLGSYNVPADTVDACVDEHTGQIEAIAKETLRACVSVEMPETRMLRCDQNGEGTWHCISSDLRSNHYMVPKISGPLYEFLGWHN